MDNLFLSHTPLSGEVTSDTQTHQACTTFACAQLYVDIRFVWLHRLTYYSQDSNADNKYFETAECLLLLRCGDALLQADLWQELLATLEIHAQRTWLDKHGDALSGQKTINKNCPPLGKEPTEPGQIMALLYVVPFHSKADCASYKNSGSDKGKGKAKA